MLDDNVVIKNLERFNKETRNGKLAKALSYSLKRTYSWYLRYYICGGASIYLIFNIIYLTSKLLTTSTSGELSPAEYLEEINKHVEINASESNSDDDMKDASLPTRVTLQLVPSLC